MHQDQDQESRTSRRHAVDVEAVAEKAEADLEEVAACPLCSQSEAVDSVACVAVDAAGPSDPVDLPACVGWDRNVREAVQEGSRVRAEGHSPCRSLVEEGREGLGVETHSQELRQAYRGSHVDRPGLEIWEAAVDLKKL